MISTTSLPDATEDSAYSANGQRYGCGCGRRTDVLHSITSGPSWLSISDSTLSGTPANDDVGDNAVTIKVSDNASPAGSATLSTTITVINVNDPPVIATTNLDDAEENTAYLFTIDASVPDVGDTLTYNLTDGPSWLSVDSLTGAFSGTPANENVGDSVAVTVIVVDNGSPQGSDTLNTAITV